MVRIIYFALSIFVIIMLTACGNDNRTFPIIVQEMDGTRMVVHRFGKTQVPLEPKRVLALGQEYMLADLLDAEISVVASNANLTDNLDGFEPQELDDIVLLSATDPNLEMLSLLNPDLIIGVDYFISRIGYDKLSAIAPVVAIDADEDWRRTYVETLAIFGKAEDAKANLADYDARLFAIKKELNANGRPISVGTIYPDQSPAAWVDGPTAVPQMLLDLGFTLSPGTAQFNQFNIHDGRVFFSIERLELFAADTFILLQSARVDGEQESLAKVKTNPIWQKLPAVQSGRVFELNRLGYPGLRGRKQLLHDLTEILKK
ncbi:MAG: ABC transporter substrate-binding protein [Anaerolineales bacterium]|nr:ABC transporter substrate-binding protein [Anaerolineales bacterium]MCX7754529.1 ABC transporter substrate-binding protein [Anaerolineales bacterium]MDW8277230.1 ABC transporter substrate-binding protein [Anaerolineales bacterium]